MELWARWVEEQSKEETQNEFNDALGPFSKHRQLAGSDESAI